MAGSFRFLLGGFRVVIAITLHLICFVLCHMLCIMLCMAVDNSLAHTKTRTPAVHFIGIGGIGMSALARWFSSQKWAVSGSDLVKSGITQELAKEGLKVKIGHKKGHIKPGIGLVVYNRAIKPDSPELLAAKQLKIPVLPYSKALGRLTKKYRTIAITGSHGKSTTTALAGLILAQAGFDPTVFLGTKLKEFGGKNIRVGKSEYLVLEADDFGAAFLDYSPTISVVTNIDKEHLDFYGNFANLKKAFLKFLARTKIGGALILNKDDKNLYSLRRQIRQLEKEKGLRVIWHSNKGKTAKKIRRVIKIPGEHNIANAITAYKIGRVLGAPHKKILQAISDYRGSWRRMEYRGVVKIRERGVENKRGWNKKQKCAVLPAPCSLFPVFDDYAHHPTEIKASLAALREKFPRRKIICVFQPHQSERLRLLFKDFTAAFTGADILILLPTYAVAGREDTRSQKSRIKSSEKLAEAIGKKYPAQPVFYLDSPKNIKSELSKIIQRLQPTTHNLKAVLVMMGAGDIVDFTSRLLGNA